MAGGVGSRFWPLSTSEYPKQFLDVLGIGKSLIQMTYQRLLEIAPSENIYILTNEKYAKIVQEQLPDLTPDQILTEPQRKNTAPCIAYASSKIMDKNPNANLIVCPSDHLITNEKRFIEILNTAINKAVSDNQIVTLGIEPSRPDTGYGYIEFDNKQNPLAGDVVDVLQFREKPNLATAQEFLSKGNFFWNSGIFIWKAATILEALKLHQKELYNLFCADLSAYNSEEEQSFVNHCFETCEDISIDFAVMEHAKNVSVVLSDFDWSDLGTWGSLNTHLTHDENENAVIGKNVHLFHSENCQVNVPNNKLVLVDSLDGYIIIDTKDKLMILKNENEQELKNYLKEMEKGSPDFFND